MQFNIIASLSENVNRKFKKLQKINCIKNLPQKKTCLLLYFVKPNEGKESMIESYEDDVWKRT